MGLFYWRKSGQTCKERCDAYGVAISAVEKLNKRCKEMSKASEQYNSLLSICSERGIILGISQGDSGTVATVIKDADNGWKEVRLYRLPYAKYARPICNMDIKCNSVCRSVHIVDWYCENENMGYGSILMKNLINYLKTADYSVLTGSICPRDFDHEDKLRHFYTKFGFQIKDHPHSRSLKLEL